MKKLLLVIVVIVGTVFAAQAAITQGLGDYNPEDYASCTDEKGQPSSEGEKCYFPGALNNSGNCRQGKCLGFLDESVIHGFPKIR